MVKIVITNINDISEDEFNLALTKLNSKKYERVKRTRSKKDKLRSVAADISARKAVAQFVNADFDSIRIPEDENHKPYYGNLFVSLSHSGDYAVCAVDIKPIGIDIEKLRPNLNRHIEKKICSTQDELDFLNSGDFIENIIKIWTMKEACFKALVNEPKVISEIKLKRNGDNFNCDGISHIETKKFQKEYIISIAFGIKI